MGNLHSVKGWGHSDGENLKGKQRTEYKTNIAAEK